MNGTGGFDAASIAGRALKQPCNARKTGPIVYRRRESVARESDLHARA
jgi:hypothetical protein